MLGCDGKFRLRFWLRVIGVNGNSGRGGFCDHDVNWVLGIRVVEEMIPLN